ncbi:MAG: response regulator [Bacteroidetes bacterium]|nr:MAG: response regulator [Bacteroidota bacterium]
MSVESNFHIFLVDDDFFQISILERHLSANSNFKVSTFNNGEDCISNLESNPDVIVLDQSMDSGGMEDCMNGDETLKKIKSEKPDIPVIIFSGYKKDSQSEVLFDPKDIHAHIQKSDTAAEEIENIINKIFVNQ